MTWAWTVRLSPAPKLVLMALADEADDTGYCFPSQRRLAWKSGITSRTVRRILSKLIEEQHVRVVPRFHGRGRTSNGYHLAMATPRTDCPQGADTGVQGVRTPVSGGAGHGCPGTHHVPAIDPTTAAEHRAGDGERRSRPLGVEGQLPMSNAERRTLEKQLAGLDARTAQQIVDELAGRMALGRLRSPSRYAGALIKRALRGEFRPELGIEIARRRRVDGKAGQQRKPAAATPAWKDFASASLPDELRLALERMKARSLAVQRDQMLDTGLNES